MRVVSEYISLRQYGEILAEVTGWVWIGLFTLLIDLIP
jgi:hypothetical protein